ncbi:hypothetical protein JW916_07055 [Candidatus Sumerlaeota bacterium]|nr:hypothetical protein [Candidatus Sumerlaeota bacterium]
MNPELQKLLALQELDREIFRLRSELGRYPALRETRLSDLDRTRRELDQARKENVDLEKRIRDEERQVLEWRASLGKLNAQQMRVKTQKEYDALTHEMEDLRRKISEADDQGLRILEEEEAIASKIAELETTLATKETTCREEVERLEEREKEKSAELVAFESRRTEQAAVVEPALLHRYGRLSETHRGTCVAPVQDGNCGGCFVRVIPSRMQEMTRDESIAECDHCHRFLYLP